jgi:dihydropteroate synthase
VSDARVWRARGRRIVLDRPFVVGIVNVTPDSFSDGGRAFSRAAAVEHALALLDAGADAVDVGGESTRPGAQPVPIAEEERRVVPVIEELRARAPSSLISVDTVKADVAERALAAGADIVNDVSGHRLDGRMSEVCAESGCGVVLMHSRGSVGEMASYALASYNDDVVRTVCVELSERFGIAERAGVRRESIVLDPGVGFAKRSEHSVAVLRGLPRIADLGYPVLVGVSRKRVIGELSGVTGAADRDSASLGASVYALLRGASLFRVHEVAATRRALDVAWRLASPGAEQPQR